MSTKGIGKQNSGRIAERIVANELSYRGFSVSDLNKEGVSANIDLLAVKDGKPWQIQVKGATEDRGWWVNYGGCDEDIIAKRKPMYNRVKGFFAAQIVVLVSVKSPKDYCCVVLPVDKAEEAAQINLDYAYRPANKDGSPKKPNKVWVSLNYIPAVAKNDLKRELMKREQEIIKPFIDNWDFEGSISENR
jgi:hypothetical protein